ncbi:tetratricopeptide repeat protein [Microcella frigidaquae]|uniref:Putative thioredoxin n=1 Tax=Microcella frigidaquae TaxID=424758 RepID=A0A840X490_9MICO|nr:tetratricopeptide repeat protein [Microcella frigidaquae]MBB5617313.1 putative thioredoxin [Microcella frigidaquae]NHN45211.1 tetratricopeptide repeat protein [Microcella frigidaquae]
MSDPSLGPSALRGAVDLSGLVRAAQQPAPATSGAPAPGGVVREVDEQSFPAVLELSRTVPVIVEFYADGIAPALGPLVISYGGRLLLVTIEGNRNPQLAQAFQIQQVPAVVALIGGRPVPLFLGMPSEQEVRGVLDQVLEAAAQSGVTGTVPLDGAADEPADEPLPPLHQEAYDAIAAGDYAAAAQAYRTAIAQNPRDQLAVAGLAQVQLLQRLEGAVVADIRQAAAAGPDDVDAQLAVADLDLSGGHVEDAFARLLRVFPGQAAEGRAAIRTRLLDYFEIVGAEDPRTVAARRALTALLY